jgi:hypothetical protein
MSTIYVREPLDQPTIASLTLSDTLKPPVKFSKKNKNSKRTCKNPEGFWSAKYKPKPSKYSWPDKLKWIARVKIVERYLMQLPPESQSYITFRGLALSRIDDDVVGNSEFHDAGFCWPEGYVEHYIGKYNVMPTKRFYNYINSRYATIKAY